MTSPWARSSTTISHSQYWKDSAIFVVEDDSQDGADHVDGHRAPIQIISPWAAHGVVDSTYYSQITHGAHDRADPRRPAAEREARRGDADVRRVHQQAPTYTPFTAVPNQVPLTEGIATAPACGLDTPGQTRRRPETATGEARPRCPRTSGPPPPPGRPGSASSTRPATVRVPDYANPEQMNRYTWYQTHEWKVPYPGDSRIYAPAQVPGCLHPEPGHELTTARQHYDATARRSPAGRRSACRSRARDQQVVRRGRRPRRRRPRHRGGPGAWPGRTERGREDDAAGPAPRAGPGRRRRPGDPRQSGAQDARSPDGVAGFVDGPGLYPSLTARQNLAALARLRGDGSDGIDDALEQVGLTDVADDRVRGFSLGMRQRLGLAAALLTRPGCWCSTNRRTAWTPSAPVTCTAC